jgi:hypothetical protein
MVLFFYVTGWRPGVSQELTPGGSSGERFRRIAGAFTDTFGPLLLLIPLSYLLTPPAMRRRAYFDIDLVCLALMVPSLVQLILWPNFQIRLLYPHGYLLSIMITVAIWRLWNVIGGVSRARSWIARTSLAFAALCMICYAIFAAQALHNFRLLLRCNELSRVAAYKKCRDLLEPQSRLYVAIMRGDQVFSEIGWRLQFFDKKNNPVIEMQPGVEPPRAGDVIYYHKRMSRLKLPQLPMEPYLFKEDGEAYLHVGWRAWTRPLLQNKPILQTAPGGNEYTVYKVKPS